MYDLTHYLVLCLTSLLFSSAGAFVASAPAAAGSRYNADPLYPTPAPVSSMITPTGPAAHLLPATPAPSFGPAASPSGIGTVDLNFLGGVPSGLRPLILGASSPGTSCSNANPNQTIAAFPYVDVFYWPSGPSNTACLSTITNQIPAPPLPTGMIEPSVYVVYPPVSYYDECGSLIGSPNNTATSTTEAYLPRDMHTLQDIPEAAPVTKVFNFSDMPCPPPPIANELDPGSIYQPVVIANESEFVVVGNNLDSASPSGPGKENLRHSYAVADPARALVRVNAITTPKVGPQP